MTFRLTLEQRLNLSVLLGMGEVTSIQETRAIWHLMDRLEPDADEKAAIGFRIESVSGSEAYLWDRSRYLPDRAIEFSEADLDRVRKAIEACPRFFPGQMRGWLRPLLVQLEEMAAAA